jgi:signal transduction histidine kinase
LGLAISFGIIKEHKGTISVESEVGKGTTFIVRIPVTAEEESKKDENSI